MKIESSNINMQSNYMFDYNHTTTKSTEIQYGITDNINNKSAISVDISFSSISVESSSRVIYDEEKYMSHEDRIKKMIIEEMIAKFYGENYTRPLEPKKLPKYPEQKDTSIKLYVENQIQTSVVGVAFETKEEYYQKQSINFNASVEINTPTNSFKLDLSVAYSKELYESHSSRLLIGKEGFSDPLVVNYDEDVNPFENLSSLKFAFDLDNDGHEELMPFLKQGAGYLALDKNKNGKIDNGSELFGTDSGNGFKDLSVYDTDNNNWIDENDAVFDKLKIWQINENNSSKLVSLLDKNIGAIYLGDVQSGYKYQNSIDTISAVQQSNGIFVKEDGSGIGIVNSIDIAI